MHVCLFFLHVCVDYCNAGVFVFATPVFAMHVCLFFCASVLVLVLHVCLFFSALLYSFLQCLFVRYECVDYFKCLCARLLLHQFVD